jgi:hypothetical protein
MLTKDSAMRMISMIKSPMNLSRTLILLCLALATLSINSMAAPVQLGGSSGQDILAQVASVNATGELTKASPTDLWNWGKIPYNYALNESGKLYELPAIDDENLWIGPVSSALDLDHKEFADGK